MTRPTKGRALACLAGTLGLLAAVPAFAGQRTWDFSDVSDLTIGGNGVNPGEVQASGGNPGQFLALTWPVGSQVSIVAFPDIDPGSIVTAFTFEADLRVGNSTGDRAADGFSVSFARSGDPALEDSNISSGNQGVFAGGIAEGGTTTGIAVSFDTWSGNTLPDGADIEGIIVRVDNRTVLRQGLPTRHGACTDPTSLQTGPRDAAYWAGGGDYQDPVTWSGLCWQPFSIELKQDAKLTVKWKNTTILDNFQTDYFPSAGQLILAGRTGGANEHTHFDNLRLTTTAVQSPGPPSTPGNLTASQVGARRVLLTWTASTVQGGSRVAYNIFRGTTKIAGPITATEYDARGLNPSTAYNFSVRAVNIAGEESAAATVSATTVAEVPGFGFPLARVYDGFTGASDFDIDTVLADPKWPNGFDRGFYVNGISFGEPAFGNTYGDNHLVAISGVLVAPATGQYHFFTRSDDAARFFLNTSGPAIPDPLAASPIAQETDCCDPFVEPGTLNDDQATSPTTVDPVSLTAGQKYGFLYLVKEGGGGDWGQVAWRLASDTTPAGQLQPIGGAVIETMGDPVGASVNITTQPASQSVAAYRSATFTVAATTTSPYTSTVGYQWYRNGTLIPGATGSSYTIPVVQPADNAAAFKCRVIVPGAFQDSADAVLTVTDSQPALVSSVEGSGTFTTATVRFDQPVAAPSATTAANYTFSGGLTVSAAAVVDQFTVRLTTSQQAENTSYNLTVANVQNLGGKPVAAGTSGVLKSWVFTLGRALYEAYGGPTGVLVDDLRNDPNYPNNPSFTTIVNAYEAPIDRADNFGGRVSGWIVPPETASYVFFISADDQAELWLSTDANPANAKLIAQEPTWNGARNWLVPDRRNADPTQRENRSDTYPNSQWTGGPGPIQLTANTRYYTHILYKEGGGGDNAAATWKKVGDPDPANGSPALTAIGTFTPQPTAELEISEITLVGGNVRITYSGTLQSAPVVTGPFTDVAGASSPYSTPPSAAQQYFRSRQ